jgi:hypothetical protein
LLLFHLLAVVISSIGQIKTIWSEKIAIVEGIVEALKANTTLTSLEYLSLRALMSNAKAFPSTPSPPHLQGNLQKR